MPMFKRRQTSRDDDKASARRAPVPLLIESEIRAHLEDELWRAGRYGRPLAVLCIVPQLLPGEQVTPAEITAASAALARRVRRSDRIGELAGGALIAVLPETDDASARAAAQRLASDLSMRSTGAARRSWRAGMAVFPEHGAGQHDLIAAAVSSAFELGRRAG